MSENRIRELTPENFDAEVLQARVPCLVDFWAEWCGHCRELRGIVEEIARTHGEKIAVGRINVDEHGDLAERFGIDTIPALVLFVDGQFRDSLSGSRSKDRILQRIGAYFSGD